MSSFQTIFKHFYNTLDGVIDSIYLSESTVTNGSTLYDTNPHKVTSIQNHDYRSSLDYIIIAEMCLSAIYFGSSHLLESKGFFKDGKNQKYKWLTEEKRKQIRWCLSEFKNAHHMMMNIGLLAHMSLHTYLILNPVGFAVGALGAVSRIQHEKMKQERKDWLAHNQNLLSQMHNRLPNEEGPLQKIKKESTTRKVINTALAGSLSFVDGNYLFGCWLLFFGIAAGVLTGWGLIAAAAGFAAYTAVSMIVKISEELDAQKELEISGLEVEFERLDESDPKRGAIEAKLNQHYNNKFSEIRALKKSIANAEYKTKLTVVEQENLGKHKSKLATLLHQAQNARTGFNMFRGLISGLKNARAAVLLCTYTICRHIVKGLAVVIASMAAAVVYGVSLMIKAFNKTHQTKPEYKSNRESKNDKPCSGFAFYKGFNNDENPPQRGGIGNYLNYGTPP